MVLEHGAAALGVVFNQDLGIMQTMQRGLRQPGLTHLTVSDFECRLVNTHRLLERYLGIGPDDPSAARF